jgi:GH15 family glucan-1,4-alpha-glucosidase
MYGVGGERWLPELTLPWLKGYANSSPVRIGNAACDQMQIDVFGEIADAAFQTYKAVMAPAERGRAVRPLILEYLTETWRQPDEGIWEVRGGRQHFVHSTITFCRAAIKMLKDCLSGCAPAATTWACWRKSSIRRAGACLAIFPRPTAMSA